MHLNVPSEGYNGNIVLTKLEIYIYITVIFTTTNQFHYLISFHTVLSISNPTPPKSKSNQPPIDVS